VTDQAKYDELVARLEVSSDAVRVPYPADVAAQLLEHDLAQARRAEADAAVRGHAPRPAHVAELAGAGGGSSA
jgi:hypothetical protein